MKVKPSEIKTFTTLSSYKNTAQKEQKDNASVTLRLRNSPYPTGLWPSPDHNYLDPRNVSVVNFPSMNIPTEVNIQ